MEGMIQLIRKVSWMYVRSNPGLEFDEVFSEACLAYLEAASSYDETKGKKSTFAWKVTCNHLNTYVKKTNGRKNKETPVDEMDRNMTTGSPEDQILTYQDWEELLSALSPEAQAVHFIINNEDIPTDPPKKARGAIVDILRERGWSWSVIWNTFKELKEVLKNGRKTYIC
jgi:hypothetical protein